MISPILYGFWGADSEPEVRKQYFAAFVDNENL